MAKPQLVIYADFLCYNTVKSRYNRIILSHNRRPIAEKLIGYGSSFKSTNVSSVVALFFVLVMFQYCIVFRLCFI